MSICEVEKKESENATRFIRRQVREIRSGGVILLIQKSTPYLLKIREIILMILTLPFILPVVLIVRSLRPFVTIRFGPLVSSRIGHFAGNTEVYLCEREMGIHGDKNIDIFYHTRPICNHQLKRMWNRSKALHICGFAYHIDKLNRFLPGGDKNVIPWRHDQDTDFHCLLGRMPPHISFTPEEDEKGRIAMKECGIPENVPFVCFLARDSVYLNTLHKLSNFSYLNYRDSDIKNHVPAIEELTRRGYFAVRMGAAAKDALNTDNPRIIDYAVKCRTDFLDVYLGAKCSFYFGDPSGYGNIPTIFRRPSAIVNMVPLEAALAWVSGTIFIPKKVWSIRARRFLTFPEIIDSGIGRFCVTKQYEDHGVEVVENTPEEITDLAIEMDDRLKGKWLTTGEDEELQKRFWLLFKQSNINELFSSRIGAKYLRENKNLLEQP